MSMRSNAAILFEPSAFDADRKKVMGRHVAGASFLEGFVRHSAVDRIVGVSYQSGHTPHFLDQVAGAAAGDPTLSAKPVSVIESNDFGELARIGTLFIPDPQVAQFAIARRVYNQRGYSLCGITHTIASHKVMEVISAMLTAPVQSWDALICTSRAARKAVLRQQEHYADYLEQRIGRRPESHIQLPVIPLGVDTERFDRLGRDGAARAALRQRLGAGERDTVVLFFGRLAFHAKAHPVPMYLGAQRAARRLRPDEGRIHLVQTGQFASPAAERACIDGAERFCPDVVTHVLDGSDRELANASWAAADVFVSLSDNIQETFGITPVEAMAAGLPCLVSDWDGYRDTVVDGETGIRIPTWMPRAGVGAAMADAYSVAHLTYDLYVGYISQMTAIDVPAFADALLALVRDPELRRRMGEAGRRRAQSLYDWRMVVGCYQDLWTDLAQRRASEVELAPPRWQSRHPTLTDPFDVFADYAGTFTDEARLRLDPDGPGIEALLAMPSNTFARTSMLTVSEVRALLQLLDDGERSVAECLRSLPVPRRIRGLRNIGWLVKYGVLSMTGTTGSGQ